MNRLERILKNKQGKNRRLFAGSFPCFPFFGRSRRKDAE